MKTPARTFSASNNFYFLACVLLSLASPPATAGIAPTPGTLQTAALERLLPPEYWQHILPDAKKLASARKKATEGKNAPAEARKLLKDLARNSSFQDVALYELARLELAELDDAGGARAHLQSLLAEFPTSSLAEKAGEMLADAEIAEGAKMAREASGAKKNSAREAGAKLIRRGLERINWKDWEEHEDNIALLLEIYRETKSPLFEGFYGEVLTALPSSSRARAVLIEKIPAGSRDRILKMAFHVPAPNSTQNARGTKAIQPDEELFQNAMAKVLDAKWTEALETFLSFKEIYPESLELERVDYWITACREALGKADEAKTGYEKIFRDSTLGYYGLEAAMRGKIDLAGAVNAEGPGLVDAIEGNLLPRQLEYLWRARALSQVGLIEDARREMDALFRYAPGGNKFGQVNARGSLALAILFSQNQYFPGAFFHMRSALQKDPSLLSRETLGLFFPKAFLAEIEPVAKEIDVDPLLLLSVAKQESAFNPDALSSARALGLMQVLLSTAAEIHDKLDKKQLLEPGRNVRVGGKYLAKLIRQFDGNVALALAAYNAGPSRAKRWWGDLQKRPVFAQGFRADAFIEAIPFKETRGYVASILRNYAWYKFLQGAELPTSVDQLALGGGRPSPLAVAKAKSAPPAANAQGATDTAATPAGATATPAAAPAAAPAPAAGETTAAAPATNTNPLPAPESAAATEWETIE